jgi:hypothetical protein
MSKIKSRHVNTQVNEIIQVKLVSKIKSRHVNTQVNEIIPNKQNISFTFDS